MEEPSPAMAPPTPSALCSAAVEPPPLLPGRAPSRRTSPSASPAHLLSSSAGPFAIFSATPSRSLHNSSSTVEPNAYYQPSKHLRPTPVGYSPRNSANNTLIIRPISIKDTLSHHALRNHFFNDLNSLTGNLGYRFLQNGAAAIDFPSSQDISIFMNINVFATIAVRILRPAASACRTGIITGVNTAYSESEIFLELSAQNPNLSVQRIQRLGRPSHPSRAVKIVFHGTALPDHVILFHLSHPVDVFVQRSTRCKNCQRFNHLTQHCTFRSTCATCSGPHSTPDCKGLPPRCANCRGHHPSFSVTCPHYQHHRLVMETKARHFVSFSEATKIVSYADAVKNPQPPLPVKLLVAPPAVSAGKPGFSCPPALDSPPPSVLCPVFVNSAVQTERLSALPPQSSMHTQTPKRNNRPPPPPACAATQTDFGVSHASVHIIDATTITDFVSPAVLDAATQAYLKPKSKDSFSQCHVKSLSTATQTLIRSNNSPLSYVSSPASPSASSHAQFIYGPPDSCLGFLGWVCYHAIRNVSQGLPPAHLFHTLSGSLLQTPYKFSPEEISASYDRNFLQSP